MAELTDFPDSYFDPVTKDWLPIPDPDILLRHNLKMRSFLAALADGHQLPPDRLVEVARKALEVPA